MMRCIDIYLKVEVDLSAEEKPERVAEELCRALCKMHAVRKAELSHLVELDS